MLIINGLWRKAKVANCVKIANFYPQKPGLLVTKQGFLHEFERKTRCF